MPDRRSHPDRRQHSVVPEGIERQRQRRHGERRESPRLPLVLSLRAEGLDWERATGDISLGGASIRLEEAPETDDLQVSFELPSGERIEVGARVVGREVHGSLTTVHVHFAELPLDQELALAKWLDDTAPITSLP